MSNMLPDQPGGRSVERAQRSLSTSAPVPTTETETRKDSQVEMQDPPRVEEEVSPRGCDTSSRTRSRTNPGVPPMLAGASSTSSTASTPAAELSCVFPPPQPRAEPPVTRATLSELDVAKIIHNPKLRHDINFDPELHFRPNLDGEKGRKKQERANQYWNTLKDELIQFVTDRPGFYEKHGESDEWSLPALLKSVKDIIQTLVPQRDRQFLDEGLNVELLMQQFHRGVADLEKLATWLSRVLKSHCAPMRDEWVDTMYSQLSNGNAQGDMDMLVTGMRSLLSVLEAMKLDVANHQIRCLRPVLIEDTTHFEQKFFYRKIQSRKLDVSQAAHWYRQAEASYSPVVGHQAQQHFGDMAVFFDALVRLVLPSSADKRAPPTFVFDEERVVKLRADIMDAVNLDLCMQMYEDLERVSHYGTSPDEEPAAGSGAGDFLSEFYFNFNTTRASSRPSSLVLSAAGSASSSPRSSLVMPSYVAADPCDKAKSQTVYNSLVSLMQSAPSGLSQAARWESMASSVALQIYRYTKAPSSMLPVFEEKLSAMLGRTDSPIYQEMEQNFYTRLMAELATRVRDYKPLSGVALFSVATGGRPVAASHLADLNRDGHAEGGVEDLATRLAHLGILHWRVWSQLAYATDADEMSIDSPSTRV
ncbi:T-complex protein 11-domain-containing protein [Stachybotrys elegans]|uniref:T-complex protein 11-domain-containing protein n=1 Tax=Stachybotrys elegans TaxID=80388 RepID=A0A8K0SYM6_9HYPO|nr:T-complex protein 11-domain-containing protein [Stachybotrys elegans]